MNFIFENMKSMLVWSIVVYTLMFFRKWNSNFTCTFFFLGFFFFRRSLFRNLCVKFRRYFAMDRTSFSQLISAVVTAYNFIIYFERKSDHCTPFLIHLIRAWDTSITCMWHTSFRNRNKLIFKKDIIDLHLYLITSVSKSLSQL